MLRKAYATINLAALKHNLRQVRQHAPNSKVLAVIKANAYGHGLLQVADALADASDGFVVACLAEADALRQHGISLPIMVLQGYSNASELKLCAARQIWPVIHEPRQLELIAQTELAQSLDVWLKISTGMNRLGFPAAATANIAQQLQNCVNVRQIRIMTHIACADEEWQQTASFTLQQIALFERSTQGLAAERSIANSATLLGWPQAQQEWVRPGIMLYGVAPFTAQQGSNWNLKPVMQLQSQLIAINSVRKNQFIGYGSTWQCRRDSKIAVVAIGYGDGYPRHIATNTPVIINQQQAPIVGRVSMDLLTVDVTDITASVGDQVILWGHPELPVEHIAQQAETIAYELLCGIHGRAHYQYIES